MRLTSKIFPHNFKSFIGHLKVIEKQKWTRGGTAFFAYLDPIKLNIRQDLFRLLRIVILSVWVTFFCIINVVILDFVLRYYLLLLILIYDGFRNRNVCCV